MSSFSKQVKAWTVKAEKNIYLVQKKVFFDLSARVIMMTPVKTGRARANWQPGLGTPNTFIDENSFDPGSVTQGGKGRSIAKDRAFSFINNNTDLADKSLFLTNSLPYIGKLEYGSSDQAPGGMVRLTIAQFSQVTEVAINFVAKGGSSFNANN